MKTLRILFAVIISSIIVLGCEEKLPSRDHIPLIKDKIFQLQEAVKLKNRASIDSLLSIQMLKLNQNSDSLLQFVYFGGDSLEAFEFTQFGNCEIFYSKDKARVDCYVMDSTQTQTRPVIFTFILNDNDWLLKRYEIGEIKDDTDTLEITP